LHDSDETIESSQNIDKRLEILETPDIEPDREILSPSKEEKDESLRISKKCTEIADSMKARDIKILDVSDKTSIADYFVLLTGFNRKQLQGIAYEIESQLKKDKIKLLGVEGYDLAWWILLDVGTVIVQIFFEEARKYYDLDLLWSDAPVVFSSDDSNSGEEI